MSADITAAVRSAMQSLGMGGKEISHQLLFEALGIDNEPDKAVVRSRITEMVKHGEASRIKDGCFVYNFKRQARPAQKNTIVWRFVRKAKPGWTVSECSLMTRVSYTMVLRYCRWLAEEGYIARTGKDERNAIKYRATAKADATPETPYPPLRDTDPFQKERVAAAEITRLMLCADPYAKRTADKICAACQVLLARFEKSVTENENENLE